MFTSIFNKFNLSKDQKFLFDVDINNHLLPYLDNGPQDLDIALEMSELIYRIGIKQCIVTPHIMKNYYENTENRIIELCDFFKNELDKNKIKLKIKPAAEYFIDEDFYQKLKNYQRLLTLNDQENYVLIESSLHSGYELLMRCIQKLFVLGYTPVLAHPEHHNFLFEEQKKFLELTKMGVKFQVNLSSFSNNASKSIKENANLLLNSSNMHFWGTNLHSPEQAYDMIKQNAAHQYTDINFKNMLNKKLVF